MFEFVAFSVQIRGQQHHRGRSRAVQTDSLDGSCCFQLFSQASCSCCCLQKEDHGRRGAQGVRFELNCTAADTHAAASDEGAHILNRCLHLTRTLSRGTCTCGRATVPGRGHDIGTPCVLRSRPFVHRRCITQQHLLLAPPSTFS